MSNVKICNLDVIAPVQPRELVINGASYKVVPLTVGRFIELNQMRQNMGKTSTIEESLKEVMKLIKVGVPEISQEVLDSMSVAQLQLVLSFIYDEIPESVLNKSQETETEEKSEDSEGK